jgi:hypothetical protein
MHWTVAIRFSRFHEAYPENVRWQARTLRHCPVRKVSLPPLRPNFPLVFKGYADGLFTFVGVKRQKSVSRGRFSLNLMTAVIW